MRSVGGHNQRHRGYPHRMSEDVFRGRNGPDL